MFVRDFILQVHLSIIFCYRQPENDQDFLLIIPTDL